MVSNNVVFVSSRLSPRYAHTFPSHSFLTSHTPLLNFTLLYFRFRFVFQSFLRDSLPAICPSRLSGIIQSFLEISCFCNVSVPTGLLLSDFLLTFLLFALLHFFLSFFTISSTGRHILSCTSHLRSLFHQFLVFLHLSLCTVALRRLEVYLLCISCTPVSSAHQLLSPPGPIVLSVLTQVFSFFTALVFVVGFWLLLLFQSFETDYSVVVFSLCFHLLLALISQRFPLSAHPPASLLLVNSYLHCSAHPFSSNHFVRINPRYSVLSVYHTDFIFLPSLLV